MEMESRSDCSHSWVYHSSRALQDHAITLKQAILGISQEEHPVGVGAQGWSNAWLGKESRKDIHLPWGIGTHRAVKQREDDKMNIAS